MLKNPTLYRSHVYTFPPLDKLQHAHQKTDKYVMVFARQLQNHSKIRNYSFVFLTSLLLLAPPSSANASKRDTNCEDSFAKLPTTLERNNPLSPVEQKAKFIEATNFLYHLDDQLVQNPDAREAVKEVSDQVLLRAEAHLKNKKVAITFEPGNKITITPDINGTHLNRLAFGLKRRFNIELRYDPLELRLYNAHGITGPNYINIDHSSILVGNVTSVTIHEIRHAYLRHIMRMGKAPPLPHATFINVRGKPSKFQNLLENYDVQFALDEINATLQGYRVDIGRYRKHLTLLEKLDARIQRTQAKVEQQLSSSDDPELWKEIGASTYEDELAYWKSYKEDLGFESTASLNVVKANRPGRLEGMATVSVKLLTSLQSGIRDVRRIINSKKIVPDELFFTPPDNDHVFYIGSQDQSNIFLAISKNLDGDWCIHGTDLHSGFIMVSRIASKDFLNFINKKLLDAEGKIFRPDSPEIWNEFSKHLEKILAKLPGAIKDYEKIGALAVEAKKALDANNFSEYLKKLQAMQKIASVQFYGPGL